MLRCLFQKNSLIFFERTQKKPPMRWIPTTKGRGLGPGLGDEMTNFELSKFSRHDGKICRKEIVNIRCCQPNIKRG